MSDDHLEEIRRPFARIRWRIQRRREDPNAFLVPFATEVDDYGAYLHSPLWKRIRAEVLNAADRKCCCCRGRATQVHHRDYRPRVLSGEDRTPLVAICKSCHDLVHMKGTNDNPSWQEQEAVLAHLIQKGAEAVASAP